MAVSVCPKVNPRHQSSQKVEALVLEVSLHAITGFRLRILFTLSRRLSHNICTPNVKSNLVVRFSTITVFKNGLIVEVRGTREVEEDSDIP